jgi:SNF2 family DNA or RNA helicase
MSQPDLWQHQKLALQRSQQIKELALFWEVGTGKTRATIDILRFRCAAHDRLLRTLVLCPKIVCTNWQREIAKYSKIRDRDVVILKDAQTKRCKAFKDAVGEDGSLTKGKIIITNYEAMDMKDLHALIMDWNPEVVIADEAHRLKNPESKRAKAVIALSDKSTYRYALTGTPILNSAMDIFNVFRFLDRGELFGRNFWKFRSIWFEDANAQWAGRQGYFPKYEPRTETYEQFNKMIYQKASRAVKSECLDLPPFVRKEVFVELSPEQKRLYKDMRDEYIAYVDDLEKTDQPRAVVAQLAVTKALRLQQIVTGYAKTEEGDIYKIESNPRIDALKELLEDLTPQHKVIVWSVFHENYADIARVCTSLGIGYAELHGKVTGKERDKNIDNFCKDPAVRVLIANQAAGGIGINLVESSVAIFYSKNFSLEQDIQSEGRNYRGGSEQHQSVTRIDIVAQDTIDELITTALATKQDISRKILEWKKEL